MGKIRFLYILPALAVLIFCTAASKMDKARAEWMGGFQKMETADKSAGTNTVGALELYQESLQIFENVRRKYPQWNPALLNYRINYCQQKIREMELKLESRANTLSAEELLSLTKRQAKELQDSENARKELDSRVAFLTEALQRAREEAAKGAGFEVTVANLAAAKANNDKLMENLRMQVRTLEEELAESKKSSSRADKLSKQSEKLRKKLDETASELDELRRLYDEKKKEAGTFERELKHLRRNYDDKETALRVSGELAESRKRELVELRNAVESADKKSRLLERNKAELEAQLAAEKRREQELVEEIESLKKLRKADAVTIGQLKAGADLATLSQAEGKRLKGELEAALDKLKAREQALSSANVELTDLRNKYNQSRAQAVASDEKNLELMSQLARTKSMQEKAEQKALSLTTELDETRILLEKSKADSAETQKKINNLDNVYKEELARKLDLQTEVARKQEEQIRLLQERIDVESRKNASEVTKFRNDLEDARGMIANAERNRREDAAKMAAAEKQITLLKEENDLLKAGNRELAAVKQELDRLKKDNENADKLLAAQEEAKKARSEAREAAVRLANADRALAGETAKVAALEAELRKARELADENAAGAAENARKFSEKLEAANGEIAALQKKNQEQVTRLTKERVDAEVKYAELLRTLDSDKVSLQKQLKSISVLREDNVKQLGRIVELEKLVDAEKAERAKQDEELQRLQDERKLLNAKVMVVDGLTRTVSELEDKIREQDRSLTGVRQEKDALQRQADAKYVSYETRLREKDQIINDLRSNAADTPTWLARLKEMEKKYDDEVKSKGALEAMLVDMESKLRETQKRAELFSAEARRAREEQSSVVRRAEDAARELAELRTRQKMEKENAAEEVREAADRKKQYDEKLAQLENSLSGAQERLADIRRQAAESARKAEETADMAAVLEKKAADIFASLKIADPVQAKQLEKEMQKIKQVLVLAKQEAAAKSAESARDAVSAAKAAAEINALKSKVVVTEAEAHNAAKNLEAAQLQEKRVDNRYRNAVLKPENSLNEDELRYTREREKKAVVTGFLRQGTDAERQGKVEAAKYNYQQALALDADNKLALQRMGLLASAAGNDTEASKYLKQAFKFDPDDMDTLLALGFAQTRLGHADWAVSYLGRAVALQPENGDAVRSYGAALFTLGWVQAAEIQLNNAIRINEKDAEAQYNLAVLLATSTPPRLKEALKWYKEAIANGAQADPGLDKVLGR